MWYWKWKLHERLEDKVKKISQKEDIRDKNETIMVPVQDTQHQNNDEKEKTEKKGRKDRKEKWNHETFQNQRTRVAILMGHWNSQKSGIKQIHIEQQQNWISEHWDECFRGEERNVTYKHQEWKWHQTSKHHTGS